MSYNALLLVGIYMLFLILISAFFVKKALDSYMEYSYCGRSLTVMFVIFTYLGTWIGGGTIVGLTSDAYANGAGSYWVFGISCIMGFVFVFLFMTRIRRLSVTGVGDMLAIRFPDYGEIIRIPTAVGLIIRNVTVLGMNFTAMSYMLTFYTRIDSKLTLLLSLGVVIIYTVSSGLWGVVVTDILQGFLQTVGMLLLFYFILRYNGSLRDIGTLVRGEELESVMLIHPGRVDVLQAFGFLVSYGLFFLMGDQSDWVRIYSCKTDRTAFWGHMIPLAITLLLLLAPTYIGAFLKNIVKDIPSSYILYWFTSRVMPAWTSSIIVIMILSATLSSADSFMVATGTILSGDIIKRFVNPEANDRELIFWTRMAVITAGAIGFAFAINTPDIMGLWTGGLGLVSIIILPAYFMAWFSRRMNTKGVLAGMGFGIAYDIGMLLTGTDFGTGHIVAGILCNVVCSAVVAMLSREPEPDVVNRTWYWSGIFDDVCHVPVAKREQGKNS